MLFITAIHNIVIGLPAEFLVGVLFGFLDMVSIVKVKLCYIEKITFGTSQNLITCTINLNQIEQN